MKEFDKYKLETKEELREFLKNHECNLETNGAYKAERNGKVLHFLYCEQAAYGDWSYYFCEEDGKVYTSYFSIGD